MQVSYWRHLVRLLLNILAVPPGLIALGIAVQVVTLAWQHPGTVGSAPGVYLAEFFVVVATATLSTGLLVLGHHSARRAH